MRIPRMALWLGLLAFGASAAAQTVPPELTLPIINPGTANNLPGVVGVRHAGDGSDRLFSIQQSGVIRVFEANRTLLTTPFLSFATNPPPLGFTSGGESGLLGLAFHPLYASNGKFYVYYLDGSGNSVVAEYTVSSTDPNLADPTTARVIVRVYQHDWNHNGGDIHFGPDGYLYIGLGDGGGSNDPCNAGQSLTSAAMSNGGSCVADAGFTGTPPANVPRGQATSRALLGKMLRIDVDSTNTPANADLCGADSALRTYGIPADNPFAGDAGGNAAACDEIYHYGLRNPFRFSFDRLTHDLIIGDVGQNRWEELDLVGAAGGHNFGWDLCEGFHASGSTSVDCPLASATDPIIAYPRSVGTVITGGFRYRGPYTALQGILFFAEAYDQVLFHATESAGTWTWDDTPVGNGIGTIVGFGEDEAGHLYLTTLEGRIRRFTLPEPVPGLSIGKSVAFATDTGTIGQADTGDVLEYTVQVTNTGETELTDLVVQDVFAGGAPQTLVCTPTTLAIDAVVTCTTYQHVVTQAEFDAGTALANVASAIALDPNGDDVGDSADTSVAIGPAQPALSLALATTIVGDDGNGVADAGEQIVSSVTVTNDGNVGVSGITVSATPGGALVCVPATLAPQASADCGSIGTPVTQADIDAGNVIAHAATAQATSARGDVLSADDATETAVAAAVPGIVATIALSLVGDVDGDGLVDEGDTVQIDTTVDNTGNVTLSDIAISGTPDADATCASDTLAPDAAATACGPVSHVVQAGDMTAGLFRATAFATATAAGGIGAVESMQVDATLDADRPLAIFADGFEGAPIVD